MLGRNNRAIQLSSDHRPIGSSKSGRNEISRVIASGGWISQMRVCGILGVTRAFGDYDSRAEGKNYSKSLRQLVYAVKVT